MEFEKLITERCSIRKFREEPLPREILDKILAAGHKAPTGCNNQPQRILVLNTAESMEKLRTCTKCHFDAPTAMLICHNPAESWKRPYDGALSSPVDAVIVTTHMMLAAQNLGVGSCWVMHFSPGSVSYPGADRTGCAARAGISRAGRQTASAARYIPSHG